MRYTQTTMTAARLKSQGLSLGSENFSNVTGSLGQAEGRRQESQAEGRRKETSRGPFSPTCPGLSGAARRLTKKGTGSLGQAEGRRQESQAEGRRQESQTEASKKKNQNSGFTLIEVLIALAILAISLTAIVKATGSDIDGNIRLKQTTIANWVASNGVNLIQAGVLAFDRSGQPLNQVTTMLKEKWYWRAELSNIRQTNIKKIIIKVRKKPDGPIIKRLDAFLIVEPKS